MGPTYMPGMVYLGPEREDEGGGSGMRTGMVVKKKPC